ncbi:N-glycosylation protein-domain-containing protein [Pseudoneurospora amorphoporcata]|uniref:N-glycosylation protein-domain-containing protein n=1 Tax=Pseudoneurospora amorphoporcata TaxID=241081 RepID=A0AAN6NZJ6_9PEZI|nr:N-glycosylation protein-domain-containing protein [Pseudoneurospora amorphoporcata]
MRSRAKSSAQQRGASHSTSNFDHTTTADRPKSRSNDNISTHIHAAATAPATPNGNGLVRRLPSQLQQQQHQIPGAPTPLPLPPSPPPPPPPPYHLLDHSHHPTTIEANSANVHVNTNNASHTTPPKPTAANPTTANVGAATPITTDMNHNSNNHNNKNVDKPPIPNMTAHSSLLQPRVAVALGVPKKWHFLLWLCRQSSTFPAIWWGLPSALRLLAMLHLIVFGGSPTTWQHIFARVVAAGVGRAGGGGGGTSTGPAGGGGDMGCGIGSNGGSMMMGSPDFLSSGAGAGSTGGGSSTSEGNANGNYNSYPGASATGFSDLSFEARLRLTETLLAIVWCGASAYLSFFFTDSLMSRWLVNYTPQATIVRLLTITTLNAYLTSQILYLTAGSQDPRLLLPAWVGISAMLTLLYHITQRKINIRKETSMSIRAFSVASFISMAALLAQVHSNRTDYPQIPLWTFVTKVWQELVQVALKIMDYGTVARDY